ncbi:MAG: thioredoxin family protein [Nitrososphaerales archaeon]
MRTEVRSAIIVFAAIGVVIAGTSIYFNSIQTGNSVSLKPTVTDDSGTVKIDKSKFLKAPELEGINGYINTEPLTIAGLQGEVVVVDFWTYSCINCIRTIPYLNGWYEKYSDDGLVILGVHAPEFEFEKDYNNVKAAVEKFEVGYPVVQDNEMSTWKAYKNNYWPHKYIIDHEGYIRYDHIGEGAYEETESVIQELLKERAAASGIEINVENDTVSPESAVDVEFSRIQTPELYLGYAYGVELGNKETFIPNGTMNFLLPEDIMPNTVYLHGIWKSSRDYMELVSDTGKVVLNYNAKAMNIVAAGDSILTIRLENVSIDNSNMGKDVHDAKVLVSEERLYNLVFSDDYGRQEIEIEVEGDEFRLYTFTFG